VFVLEQEDPELFDRVQEQNLNRQYELLTNCIEIGLKKGPTAFDKYMLWALNHVAVANISQFGGALEKNPFMLGTISLRILKKFRIGWTGLSRQFRKIGMFGLRLS
jgi:hypothetical protein